jgi:HlyD family secretion protein
MTTRIWLLGALLVGSGLAAGFMIGARGDTTPASAAQRVQAMLTVSVIRPERKTIDDVVHVVGQTRSRDEVMVIPELTGLRVLRIDAEVGDVVRAGQTLAILDGKRQDIERDGLRSEYERTRGEYERARTLVTSQLISREFFKQKQSAYEQARADYDNAKLDVQRTRVVAPAGGLVYRRSATIGGLTDGSVALFEIAKDGVIEMEASVPETMVGRLRPGMPVSVEVAGGSGAIAGDIRLISPNVDNLSRVAAVRVRIHDTNGLQVGAFAQAKIDVAKVDGWLIPRSALQQDASGPYVWRVDNKGAVSRLPVTPSIQNAQSVIVAESLDGSNIVAKAGPFLRENDRVRIAKPGT